MHSTLLLATLPLLLATLPLLAVALSTPAKRATGVTINDVNHQCLVAGTVAFGGKETNVSAGDAVGFTICDYASLWDISPGAGHVVLHGTDLVLDAGAGAKNGSHLTVQPLSACSPSQNWYYTGDQRIALTNGTLCLDSPLDESNAPDMLKCTTGDTRQAWTLQ